MLYVVGLNITASFQACALPEDTLSVQEKHKNCDTISVHLLGVSDL